MFIIILRWVREFCTYFFEIFHASGLIVGCTRCHSLLCLSVYLSSTLLVIALVVVCSSVPE